jgi:hypothetical protein
MEDFPILVYPAKVLFCYNLKYFNLKFSMGLGVSFRTNLNFQVETDMWEEWQTGSEEYRRLIKNYIVKGIRNLVVQIQVIGLLGREIGIMEIPLAGTPDGDEETFHGSPLISYTDFLREGYENQWNIDRLQSFENLNLHYHL